MPIYPIQDVVGGFTNSDRPIVGRRASTLAVGRWPRALGLFLPELPVKVESS